MQPEASLHRTIGVQFNNMLSGHPGSFQAILKSFNHQDSMVLAQRQKYRSMEQNRKPRDKSMHPWTPYP